MVVCKEFCRKGHITWDKSHWKWSQESFHKLSWSIKSSQMTSLYRILYIALNNIHKKWICHVRTLSLCVSVCVVSLEKTLYSSWVLWAEQFHQYIPRDICGLVPDLIFSRSFLLAHWFPPTTIRQMWKAWIWVLIEACRSMEIKHYRGPDWIGFERITIFQRHKFMYSLISCD